MITAEQGRKKKAVFFIYVFQSALLLILHEPAIAAVIVFFFFFTVPSCGIFFLGIRKGQITSKQLLLFCHACSLYVCLFSLSAAFCFSPTRRICCGLLKSWRNKRRIDCKCHNNLLLFFFLFLFINFFFLSYIYVHTFIHTLARNRRGSRCSDKHFVSPQVYHTRARSQSHQSGFFRHHVRSDGRIALQRRRAHRER